MATLITNVEVHDVPDDVVPEVLTLAPHSFDLNTKDPYAKVKGAVSKELCDPYEIVWHRLPTRFEIEHGNFEIDSRTGEPLPKSTRFILFMPSHVQQKLGMIHNTWEWLVKERDRLHDLAERRAETNRGLMDRIVELSRPWYKRVWRRLLTGRSS